MSLTQTTVAHHHRRVLTAPLLLAASLTLLASPPPAPADEFDALFQRIHREYPKGRSVPAVHGIDGGFPPILSELACARFAATSATQREIDRAAADDQAYLYALYAALGAVKDPATIGWLNEKLKTGHRQYIYDAWPTCWQPRAFNPVFPPQHDFCKFLTQPDAWRAFLIELHDRAPDARTRFRVLVAMSACLHDQATIAYFRTLAASASGEEYFVACAYLECHGQALDAKRLKQQLSALDQRKDANHVALACAWGLHNEALIPWLLSRYRGREWRDAQSALQKLTFQTDLHSKDAWRAWWAAHEHETRADWLRMAMEAADGSLANGTATIAEQLQTNAAWRDPALAPWVQKWLSHKDLHRVIGGWVSGIYDESCRAALQPIAEVLVRESWNELDDDTQYCFTRLDFVPGKELTWEDSWCPK